MAAAVLLRSVARKMSRAAAPTHHRSLVERGLHGGSRSGPANSNLVSNQVLVQQGTADVLVSAGMAPASGLRSGAGRLTTKMAHAPPPPQYHRLVHGRGIHNRNSPDPISPTTKKILDALDMAKKASLAVGFVTLFGCAIYIHFGLKPKLKKLSAMLEDLREKSIHSQNLDASSVSRQTPTAPASGEGKEHL